MSDAKTQSRREFLKNAAIAGAAAAAGSLVPQASSAAAPVPEKWDKEADVVVVGFGGAGAATAFTAADAGAKVLILEKNSEGKEGGNTRVSGNLVLAPQAANKADFLKYIKSLDMYDQVSDATREAVAAEYVMNEEWLNKLGAKMQEFTAIKAEFPAAPGSASVRNMTNGAGMGNELVWKVLAKNVADRKIEVLYSTPGKHLVRDNAGQIVGILAENGGKSIAVKAKRAVVLTTGGFEYNAQMQKDYALAYPILYAGNPANTGDGITMALEVGADLWHMNNVMGAATAGMKVPGFAAPALISLGTNTLFVNKFGQRFINEMKDKCHGWNWRELYVYSMENLTFPQLPFYAVFDDKARAAAPLATLSLSWVALMEKLTWSKDNLAEVDKGWILKANTLDELAGKIAALPSNGGRMKGDVLAATVARFNGFAKAGKDDDYGRVKGTMTAQETPPYYAIEMWPVSMNTQGGPRRDEKGRVLDLTGKPISRLYSAGELGSFWASLYQGAGNVGECMAYGRISGRNAAAEKAWDAA